MFPIMSTLQINRKSIQIRMADNDTYPLDSQNSGSKSSEVHVLTSLVSFWPKIRPVHLKTGEVFSHYGNKIQKKHQIIIPVNSWKQMGVLLIVLLFIAGKHLRFKGKIAFFIFAFLAHPFICFVSNCPACLKCKHLLSSYQDSPVGCQNSSDLSTIDNSGLWYLSQKILFLKRLVLTRTISFSI